MIWRNLDGRAGPGLWGKSARLRPLSAIIAVAPTPLRPSRMRKPKAFFRVLTESGPLVALTVAIAILVGIAGPASAQFFNFGGWSRPAPRHNGGGGWFGGDFFAPFQQQPQPQRRAGFLQGAAARQARSRLVPERNVLVLGDGMADWLASGLEDAYVERPDMGVIRKNRATSGLIKYQPKGEPSDWAAAAKANSRDRKARRHRRDARHQRPRRHARAGHRENPKRPPTRRRAQDATQTRGREAGGQARCRGKTGCGAACRKTRRQAG